jgi:1-acyl-sn-glycerol-3-phosphate acyltransferase
VIEQPIALQPVAIRYWRNGQLDTNAAFIGDDDLLSHLRRLLAAPSAQVTIELLPALQALPGENRNQLARRAQHCIAQSLHSQAAPTAATPTANADPQPQR